MKTVERAHKPATLWHRVALHHNYADALNQIDELLSHWSRFIVHKSKQRLTKITQLLLRTRKAKRNNRSRIVTIPARRQKNEARREAKAQVAAQLENSIEHELLKRLRSGTYDNCHARVLESYTQLTSRPIKERSHLEIEYEKYSNEN
mmetsp:Transcript_13219/g.57621  ORF Transcript_13219/g.57621 Transcript_13219/m.57621 type:complete len:148 (-) Transcript_13219:1958-2401(-)